MEENAKNCIFVASIFVFHSQTLIFSLFKIVSFPPHLFEIKLSMSLLFYLVTFAIHFWQRKFVTATINMVHVFSNESKSLIKTHKYTQNAQLHTQRD